MKLTQREYCHNCNKDVDYEFEDTTQRQVIICPNCGHQHYREIDETTLIRIRTGCKVAPDMRELYEVEETDFPSLLTENDEPLLIEMKIKKSKIVGQDENSGAIIEKEDKSGKKHARISERRWGRDPRQGA